MLVKGGNTEAQTDLFVCFSHVGGISQPSSVLNTGLRIFLKIQPLYTAVGSLNV